MGKKHKGRRSRKTTRKQIRGYKKVRGIHHAILKFGKNERGKPHVRREIRGYDKQIEKRVYRLKRKSRRKRH